MTPEIATARARLNRAIFHIRHLNRIIGAFKSKHPYKPSVEPNADGVFNDLWIRREFDLPISASLTANDAIHSLRSILDNLAWGLARRYGYSKDTQIAFPICKNAASINKELAKLTRFHQDAKDLIRDVQPHDSDGNLIELHCLWILNRLWNTDKHAVPPVLGGLHKNTALVVGDRVFRVPPQPEGKIVHEDVKLFSFAVVTGGQKVNIKPHLQFEIVYGDSVPVVGGHPVLSVLWQLYEFVRKEIVEPFTPIFDEAPEIGRDS